MLVKHNSTRFRHTLGESGEDYLEAILLLEQRGRPVRVKELARILRVSRPSVVGALAVLEEKGLVRHEHYGGVELTVAGRSYARRVYQRHRLLERFLREVLGVSPTVATEDACRLEHTLSSETIRRLIGYIQRQGKDAKAE